MWNTAPPSGWLRAVIVPPCLVITYFPRASPMPYPDDFSLFPR